jgi:hypothetical protein
MNEDILIEELAGAHRPPHRSEVPAHPRFLDVSPEARETAYRLACELRPLEAALDPEGLSTTARAVLARLSSALR